MPRTQHKRTSAAVSAERRGSASASRTCEGRSHLARMCHGPPFSSRAAFNTPTRSGVPHTRTKHTAQAQLFLELLFITSPSPLSRGAESREGSCLRNFETRSCVSHDAPSTAAATGSARRRCRQCRCVCVCRSQWQRGKLRAHAEASIRACRSAACCAQIASDYQGRTALVG